MIEFRHDIQLLIEGKNLNEYEINDCFNNNFVGYDKFDKIHYHANEP